MLLGPPPSDEMYEVADVEAGREGEWDETGERVDMVSC